MNGQTIRTFLSANSAKGFFSRFDEFLQGKKSYVIKGGPGTGKSTFMKMVAAAAVERGNFTEYVYCSSDPDSLDGVYIHGENTAFVDGTPPHVVEPRYPGVMGGIVDVGRFLDEKSLDGFRNEVISLNKGISASYARGYRYLKAAECAFSEIRDMGQKYYDENKGFLYLKKVVDKVFDGKKWESPLVHTRFLSGITPKGYVSFRDTVYTLSTKVLVLRDRFTVGGSVLEYVKERAEAQGFEVYCFYSPLMPDTLLHVAIPQLDTAFVTSDRLTDFAPREYKAVDMKRFFADISDGDKKYLASAAKLFRICLDEAVQAFRHSKALHDDLEDIYIRAMDFPAMEAFTEKYL